MKITNALKEKINRQVRAKFEERRTALNKEYNKICEDEKIRLKAIILNALEREPELTILLGKPFGCETLIEKIDYSLRGIKYIQTEAIADINKKIFDLNNEQATFLEDFLINVSYEKNIDRIKTLFSNFGLSF